MNPALSRVALYARVSTTEQTTENQLLQLRAWASSQKGMEFEEHEESVSSRKTRPKKEEILKRLRMGTLDGVAFVSLSRWGRSTTELVGELRDLHDLGRGMWSLKEGISLDTAAGRAMVGMLAVFAEFERDLAQERILAGLARRKAQGFKLGWPKGKPRHPPENRGSHAEEPDLVAMSGVIGGGNGSRVGTPGVSKPVQVSREDQR